MSTSGVPFPWPPTSPAEPSPMWPRWPTGALLLAEDAYEGGTVTFPDRPGTGVRAVR
ncbi:hypothetical protein [Haloplanus pelagicus]|uniref:hypothetical protein n=1 Tax=Haloplanus pelagicus TaxID=2949995 RepID=UPI002041E0BF|nr:hypothetical protein [Haloplanus sp. HW8-1]